MTKTLIAYSLTLFILMSFTSFAVASGKPPQKTKVTVGLDYYFNNEWKKDQDGKPYRFHYTWEDTKDSGFSMWDSAFTGLGAETVSIEKAPVKANLSGVDIYVIVDPDTKKETEKPNFIGAEDIKNITSWVKAGGILVLMANDSSNAELDHLNNLAREFGIKFNKDLKNPVTGRQFEMGKIMIPEGHPIFAGVNQIYIKEFASQELRSPAKAVLTHNGDIVISTSHYGKGLVIAVGDPWLYNEYSNRSRLSEEYQNYLAGEALAKWMISQVKSKSTAGGTK